MRFLRGKVWLSCKTSVSVRSLDTREEDGISQVKTLSAGTVVLYQEEGTLKSPNEQ